MLVSTEANIVAGGYGAGWDTSLEYNNFAAMTSGPFGRGWTNSSMQGLVIGGGQINYPSRPTAVKSFVPASGGGFQANYYVQDKLSFSGGVYTMLRPGGATMQFNSSGVLQSMTTPAGVVTNLTYNASNQLQTVITTVTDDSGTHVLKFAYTWTGSQVTKIIYSVDDFPIQQVTYDYDSSQFLQVVKQWENIGTAASPDWGSRPVAADRFSYYSGTGLLKIVLTPAEYRQMDDNNLHPDIALDPALEPYAETEYVYDSASRVITKKSHGGLYTLTLVYTPNFPGTSSLNAWASKTAVTYPDSSVRTFYVNRVQQLMLETWLDPNVSPARTWNIIYQNFDENSARLMLSADAAAIVSVNEASASLVVLAPNAGKITKYTYNANGDLALTQLKNGNSSSATTVSVEQLDYAPRTVGTQTIYRLSKRTVFRNDDGSGAIATTYTPTWYTGNFQVSSEVTTLPTVTAAENGTGATATQQSNYDTYGFLSSSTDESGLTTSYVYKRWLGAMIRKTVGSNLATALQQVTDYSVDNLGRVTQVLGPKHDIVDASLATVSARTAQWTYYMAQSAQTWEFSGYQLVSDASNHVVSTIAVAQSSLAVPHSLAGTFPGWRQASTYEAVYSGSGLPDPATTVFAQSSWMRWSVGWYDKAGQLRQNWTYFVIPTTAPVDPLDPWNYGARTTNYGRKLLEYDVRGRLYQTTCAGDTTDQTDFNAINLPIKEWLGIYTNLPGLVVTKSMGYDDNGNVNIVTQPVDNTGTNDRVSNYHYDWRNRLGYQWNTVEKDGGGNWTLYTVYAYNNLDQPTSISGYHTSIDVTTNRISYNTSAYDVRGRVYQTSLYAVRQVDGGTGHPQGEAYNPQISNTYYIESGQVARSAPAGSQSFTVNIYDAFGRTVTTYLAFQPGNAGFVPGSDPTIVSTAVVMEQTEYAYDAANNVLSATSKKRFDLASADDSKLGPLSGPSVQPKARISYMAYYYDALNRQIAAADLGTNGGATWSRDPSIPVGSDTKLVNLFYYNAAGNRVTALNPAGVQTLWGYDNDDRLIKLAEDNGGVAGRYTDYGYTDDGWLKSQSVWNGTASEVTTWSYGVTNTGGTSGSWLDSNRLVLKKTYADHTGTPGYITYAYNRQQQTSYMTDQANTQHSYIYDKLGRLLFDTVPNFGSNIDSSISVLGTSYNERGLVIKNTSLNAFGVAVNQVLKVYNDFNQLITEYQEHNGLVSTTGTVSKSVQYQYENGAAQSLTNGTWSTTRFTTMVYPDSYNYGAGYNSNQAKALSRPDQMLKDGTARASYQFLGLAKVVNLIYDEAGSAQMTYVNPSAPNDAGDQYTGLDRFGRIQATLWKTSTTTLVNSLYGRNRLGSVLWRQDILAEAASANQDTYYTYDPLQQVTQYQRGTLTTGGTPPGVTGITAVNSEGFTYDLIGNWTKFQTPVVSPALDQRRDYNLANQITGITNPGGVVQAAYDPAGNMTTTPIPANWTTGYDLVWDAWNRLVKVLQHSTTTQVARYAYDALGRRATTTTPAGGSSTTVRDFYYDTRWRAVEEQVGGVAKDQYMWDLYDRWNMLRRKRTVSGAEYGWCLKDNLDPVAVIDTTAAIQYRMAYDAFGTTTFLSSGFGSSTKTAADWNLLFHEEFADIETGLYNYGYRYYHTSLGRWISRDPIGEKGGINLYAFVGNNSTNLYDRYGLISCPLKCQGQDIGQLEVTVSPTDSGATAKVQYTAEKSKKPCCCSSFKVIQFFKTNINIKTPGPNGLTNDVLPTQNDKPYVNPQQVTKTPDGLIFTDSPERPDVYLNNETPEANWQGWTFIVCIKAKGESNEDRMSGSSGTVLLQGASWGFSRKKGSQGSVKGPTCVGSLGGGGDDPSAKDLADAVNSQGKAKASGTDGQLNIQQPPYYK